ncbi:MAG: SAM-dependent methyltransferase [Pseudomonadota bacterium]|nr:SAM-dependent methyltransferase [Pseudomonadota bacterium]
MPVGPQMNTACPSSDRVRFLRAWLQNPWGVASVTPSSRSLAQLITSGIGADTGRVLELGPGTGVFTDMLLERGVSEPDLTLVEMQGGFAAMLKGRYPAASVLMVDAARLGRHLQGVGKYGATVSGLPLLSMSPRQVMGILRSCFQLMDAHASFYQFTYGPRCPVPPRILDRLGLTAVRIGWTPNNLPPAAVYRLSRRPAGRVRRSPSV